MSKTFAEFMREESQDFEYNEDIVKVSHGCDIKGFKQCYEWSSRREGVEIHRKDEPKILRYGFVILDGEESTWHTIRCNAWKSYENFRKEIFGDKDE